MKLYIENLRVVVSWKFHCILLKVAFLTPRWDWPLDFLYAIIRRQELAEVLFSSDKKPKTFKDSSSHRILPYMHVALNIDENKN